MGDDQLIFLISQPRAGSTMLQALLSNNNRVATTSEHWLLLNATGLLKPDLLKADFNAWAANDALQSVYNVERKQAIEEGSRELALRFYSTIGTGNDMLVLDKTPRYYEIIPEIRATFPGARIILLIRDPRAVLRSIMDTWNLYTYQDLYEMRRDIFHAPSMLLQSKKDLASDPLTQVVRFEDLLDNPGTVVGSLYRWLGLNYTDAVLDYSKNEQYKGKYGDPIGAQAAKKPGKMKEWSAYETSQQYRSFFEGYSYYLKDILEDLGGYAPNKSKPTRAFNYFFQYCHSRYPDGSGPSLKKLFSEWMLRSRSKGMYKKA